MKYGPEYDSDIPEVKIPDNGFKSDLPDFLLEGCSPKDKYMFEILGEVKHYMNWSAPIIVDSNLQVRKTNGRVNKLEDQISSWVNFKQGLFKLLKNKYVIIFLAFVIFVALFPLVNWINSTGGLVSFIQTIIKMFTS